MDEKNKLNSISTPCGCPYFLKVCRQIAMSLPTCSGINPHFKAIRPKRSFNRAATLVDIFEVSDILVKKGLITLRDISWCMFPVIMKGDILKVRPSKVDEMNIGEIAVFRHSRWLYAHRVIDKKEIDGRSFIFTRPDGSESGNGSPIGDDDLLGKVTAILRKGKTYSPQKRHFSLNEKTYHFFILLRIRAENRLRKEARFLLGLLQKYKIFRTFLFKLLAPLRSKMRFSIGIPTNLKATARFFNYVRLKDITPDVIERIKKAQRWHMVITYRGNLLGSTAIINRPDSCPYNAYWIEDLFVRGKFRGARIGTQGWERLKSILERLGIDKIYVSVPKDDVVARDFFKSIEFKYREAYEDRLEIFEKVMNK